MSENTFDAIGNYVDYGMTFSLIVFYSNVVPLASLLCCITSYFKLNLSIQEMQYQRRVEPEISFGIGKFLGIFEIVSHLALIINVAIALWSSETFKMYFFTTDSVWNMDSMKLLLFLVVIEHALIVLKMFIAYGYESWAVTRLDMKKRSRAERTRKNAILRKNYETDLRKTTEKDHGHEKACLIVKKVKYGRDKSANQWLKARAMSRLKDMLRLKVQNKPQPKREAPIVANPWGLKATRGGQQAARPEKMSKYMK